MTQTASATHFMPPMPRMRLKPVQWAFSAGMAGIRRAFSTLCPPREDPMLARASGRFRPPRRAWRAFFFFVEERKEQKERGEIEEKRKKRVVRKMPAMPAALESPNAPGTLRTPMDEFFRRTYARRMPAVCPPCPPRTRSGLAHVMSTATPLHRLLAPLQGALP